jgi:tellurium resistance protein TerD
MGVSLQKGGNVSLTKEAPGLTAITIGTGWDARATDGQDFDLDVSVFVIGTNGKVLTDQHFVFYNNPTLPGGAVAHQGDNRTGEGDGDDEQIKVQLNNLSEDEVKLIVAVTIDEAAKRGQNFGQVSNAYMRIVNDEGGAELARFDLSEDASLETAMIFGELYSHNGEWKFKAIEQGFADGLGPLAASYGVNLA